LKDQRGVWTEQDDHDLEGGDGRGIKRVEEKHGWGGWGGCEERLEFLRMVREFEG
jgi:TRF2-interacting telomeric protein/Rap1 - C terminal domain